MTTVLLTGFLPFAGDAHNPSGDAVRRVAEQWAGAELLITEILPVVFEDAARRVRELMDEHDPSVVVATGLAGGRHAVGIERVAVNLRDARIADNAGGRPIDEPCVPAAPGALFSTLPVKAIVRDVAAAGIPCELSLTAGTFVCNDVFFHAVDAARPPQRAGFVHVPWATGQAPGGEPELPLEDIVRALQITVRTALDATSDVRVPGGTLH